MRKLRRMVLRNEANRLSDYGKNGKSIAIFRSLWADYKEVRHNKKVAKKGRGILAQIKRIRQQRAAQRL